MVTEYARPVLCRLCGFPAPDGGVPVSEVDREKLSEWCRRTMDTELDGETLENALICNFCVWQAWFEYENAAEVEDDSDYDWWSNTSRTKWKLLEKFYSENIIRPCSVLLENMSDEEIQMHLRKRTTKRGRSSHQTKSKARQIIRRVSHKCVYCSFQHYSKVEVKKHVDNKHWKIQTFECKVCEFFFKSNDERQRHFEEKHKKRLTCIYCKAPAFNAFPKLHRHVQKKHKKAAIQCKLSGNCYRYFRTKAERKEHVKKVHPEIRKSRCIYCKEEVLEKVMFLHMRQSHNSEFIRCDYSSFCSTYFLTQEEKKYHIEQRHLSLGDYVECVYCRRLVLKDATLRYHMKRYHSKEVIRCNFNTRCPTYFLTKADRQKHIRQVHEEKLLKQIEECVYCLQTYPDSNSLVSHVNYAHSDVKIKCKWHGCRVYFRSEEDHRKHFIGTHSDKEKKKIFQCAECSYKAPMKKTLKLHIVSQHVQLKLQCPECPKSFRVRAMLSRHVKRCHANAEKSQCEFCRKHFWVLSTHLVKKRCKNCGFVANCLSENSQHFKSCGKKHKCDKCGEHFHHKGKLDFHLFKEHVASSSSRKLKETRCRVCYMDFRSKALLEQHKKGETHRRNLNKGPFICDLCQKEFSSRKNITHHISKHHLQNKEVSCPECGKVMAGRSNLMVHVKAVHSEVKLVECEFCYHVMRPSSMKWHVFTMHRINNF